MDALIRFIINGSKVRIGIGLFNKLKYGINFFAEGKRTLNSMGLEGLTVEELKTYLQSGEMPAI